MTSDRSKPIPNVEPSPPSQRDRTTVVIVPTFNERNNVGPLASAIVAAAPSADVLFVDDNSPDGTGEVVTRLAKANERVRVLHRPAKAGLGPAYVAGLSWALSHGYERVVHMDADFSHDPADVPRLLGALDSADVALGSRYSGGTRVVDWPWHRLALSRAASLYVRWITGLPVDDPTGGFKAFRRAVLDEVLSQSVHSNGYIFNVELTHHAWLRGFRIEEVPITFTERRTGDSKMSLAIILEAIWTVWSLLIRGRFRRGPRARHPRSVATASGRGR